MLQTVDDREVPFFNYPSVFSYSEERFLEIVTDVGRRGAFILQEDVKRFEKRLAEFTGAKYAIGVGNCTDGLEIMLQAAGLGPGDEVIFSSHTFVATAAAIHHVGATPVPVECRADHLIDPESVVSAITGRTKAVMPTQLNGRTADMDALEAIAKEHGLLIIEDAAQALGSTFKGKMAGTFGVAGAFSFYPAKNLGAFGDAGAIITSDDDLYRTMLLMRDHGRDRNGEVVMWGRNSRLDNLHAAILDYKLARYEQEVNRRREIAGIYQERLEGLPELKLPPGPEADSDHFDVFQNYEVEAERRDELRAYLGENGIGTAIQWGGKAVHQFAALGFDVELPYTEELFRRCLLLPMNSSLADEDAAYVANKIREFYGRE